MPPRPHLSDETADEILSSIMAPLQSTRLPVAPKMMKVLMMTTVGLLGLANGGSPHLALPPPIWPQELPNSRYAHGLPAPLRLCAITAAQYIIVVASHTSCSCFLHAGFLVAPLAPTVRARAAPAVMGAIEDAAMNCLEDGCSVDTLNDLLKELKAEASENVAGDAAKSQRKEEVLMMIKQLSVLSPDTELAEIEKIVRGAARSFSTVDNFSFKGPAVGYSMKPGSTTTAGKSLD